MLRETGGVSSLASGLISTLFGRYGVVKNGGVIWWP